MTIRQHTRQHRLGAARGTTQVLVQGHCTHPILGQYNGSVGGRRGARASWTRRVLARLRLLFIVLEYCTVNCTVRPACTPRSELNVQAHDETFVRLNAVSVRVKCTRSRLGSGLS